MCSVVGVRQQSVPVVDSVPGDQVWVVGSDNGVMRREIFTYSTFRCRMPTTGYFMLGSESEKTCARSQKYSNPFWVRILLTARSNLTPWKSHVPGPFLRVVSNLTAPNFMKHPLPHIDRVIHT